MYSPEQLQKVKAKAIKRWRKVWSNGQGQHRPKHIYTHTTKVIGMWDKYYTNIDWSI